MTPNARTLASLVAVAMTAWACPAAAQAGSVQSPYVVLVDYSVEAKNLDELKSLILGVASASIAEPGCRRFDVMAPTTPGHILLWEVFDDANAFQAHTASVPFKDFVAAAGKLGATRVATPGSFVVTLQKP